jgi:hypothetical protein
MMAMIAPRNTDSPVASHLAFPGQMLGAEFGHNGAMDGRRENLGRKHL